MVDTLSALDLHLEQSILQSLQTAGLLGKLKMKLQIALNADLTDKWAELVSRPEFVGMNNAGIMNTLIIRYTKTQDAMDGIKPTDKIEEKDTRTPTEKLRDEAAARRLEQYRSTGVWPKPAGSHNGTLYWAIPKHEAGGVTWNQSMPFDPPADYTGPQHPGAEPIDQDPMPEIFDEADDTPEFRAALNAWKARNL